LTADFVNDLLSYFVLEQLGVACSTEGSGLQNFRLLLEQLTEFRPQFFDVIDFHGASLGEAAPWTIPQSGKLGSSVPYPLYRMW
jgi:hypothetical protein